MQSFSSFCFLLLLPLIGAVCPPVPSKVCIDQHLVLQCQLKEKLKKYGEQLGGCNVFSGNEFCKTNPTEMNTFCCQTFQTECGASPTTTPTPTLATSTSVTSSTPTSTSTSRIDSTPTSTSSSSVTIPDANTPKDPFCSALDENSKLLFQLAGANDGTALARSISVLFDKDTLEKLIQSSEERKLSVDDLGMMGTFWGIAVVPMVKKMLNLDETRTDFLDWEKNLAYLTVEASKRLLKCNGCFEPVVRILFGDLLIPDEASDSPSTEEPTLKMTVPQFTTRLIEVVGALGKGLGDLAPKHPANEPLSFNDFMGDVKNALGGAVGPDDLGGFFNQAIRIIGPLKEKMGDPKAQAEIKKSLSNIYENDFKCGDLVIPSLPQLTARRLVASPEKEINFIPPVRNVSKCSDNPHDFLISLETTYGKMDCNDYITASGCIPKGNLLSVTELVDVCRDTWTTRCADTVFGPSTTVPEAMLVEIQKILSDNRCMTETTQPPATTHVTSSAQLTACTAVALFASVLLVS